MSSCIQIAQSLNDKELEQNENEGDADSDQIPEVQEEEASTSMVATNQEESQLSKLESKVQTNIQVKRGKRKKDCLYSKNKALKKLILDV